VLISRQTLTATPRPNSDLDAIGSTEQMKRLVIVAIASAVIAVSVLIPHRTAVGLIVGIVVGTWYFLQAVVRGGGIATVRITQDPGVPRMPIDPDGSVGMGLAAAAIATAVIGSPDYSPYHAYFVFFLVAGLSIALAYAIVGYVAELRARRSDAAEKPGSAV